jgi:hypothetical protein
MNVNNKPTQLSALATTKSILSENHDLNSKNTNKLENSNIINNVKTASVTGSAALTLAYYSSDYDSSKMKKSTSNFLNDIRTTNNNLLADLNTPKQTESTPNQTIEQPLLNKNGDTNLAEVKIEMKNINKNNFNNNINAQSTNQEVQIKIHSTSMTSLNDSHNRRKKKSCCKRINRKAIKRPLPCIFAWIMLLGATGAYSYLVTPLFIKLVEFYTAYSILLVQFIIFFYTCLNFMIAIFRDPGRFEKYVIRPDDPNFADDTKSPLYKSIQIRKSTVKIKWCSVSYFCLFLFCNN